MAHMRYFFSIFLCFLFTQIPALAQVPPVTVTVNTKPGPGHLYLAPNSRVENPPYSPVVMVLDSAGTLVKSRVVPEFGFDCKVLDDGRIGYSVFQAAGSGPRAASSVYVLDSNLATKDSLFGGNGYNLAMHAIKVLPNGNRMLVFQEDVIVDMSLLVPGGHPAAKVQQMLLQEVDIYGRVVFQWRALDHFPVTVSYENLTSPSIRYFHLNAFEIDTDGNILISARHSSLVAKIRRTTGEVMWILGGKLNQFTFSVAENISDPPEFSYQHDVRRLPNGNISVFDNGTQRIPSWSRGVEYQIDEEAKTCKLVWQYRPVPDVYAGVQGSMQTLNNGNRILAWGSALRGNQSLISEVDDEGNVVFEARMPSMMFPYKVDKQPYPAGRHTASVFIDEILPLNTYVYTRGTDTVGAKLTYHTLISFFYNSTIAKRYHWAPENPRFVASGGDSVVAVNPPSYVAPLRVTLEVDGMVSHAFEVRFDVDVLRLTNGQSISVYYRPTPGSGSFKQLRTRFNQSSRELVVDTAWAGEFCFGSPLSPLASSILSPRIITPSNGRRVLASSGTPLQVSPQGPTTAVRFLIARSESGDVVFDRTKPSDKDTSVILAPGMYYFSAIGEYSHPSDIAKTTSEVSPRDSFIVAAPFIEVPNPSQPVVWSRDSSYAFTWQTNLSGLVSIELMKNDEVAHIIADSVSASSQGFLWRVPVSVPLGKDYALRVRTRDGQPGGVYSGSSLEVIEIGDVPSSVSENIAVSLDINVAPNPAIDRVYVGGSEELTNISIYAISGVQVYGSIIHGAGASIPLSGFAPGVYTMRIATRRGIALKSLIINR